jgi:DNA-binding XRE family transcriptional regulator
MNSTFFNQDTFPGLFKQLRKNRKINQESMGLLLGVRKQTVMRWEKGLSKPTTENLSVIINKLHLASNYFSGKADNKINPPELESHPNGVNTIVNDTSSEYTANCPADIVCRTICKTCIDSSPEDKDAFLMLSAILGSDQEGTKLAIKQNLREFVRLVNPAVPAPSHPPSQPVKPKTISKITGGGERGSVDKKRVGNS